MPIGPYADFGECVGAQKRKGKSDDSAKKICGFLEKQAKGGTIEETENGDLYLKTFLLDSSLNQNEWGVVPETLDNNIRSFIGKPYVVQEDFRHPESNDTYDHHLQYQERFAIGRIADITNRDGIYSALIKVTDNDARQAIRNGNFPLYVSPQLWHEEEGQVSDTEMKKWKGTHLAAVEEPAFGIKKARVTAQCNGDSNTCLAQLKAATCKFCIKKTIENYKNARMFIPHKPDPNIILNTLVTKNSKQDYSSLRNKKLNNSRKLSEQTELKSYSEEEYNKLKTANEQLSEKVKILEGTNTKLAEENKTVSASLESLKGEWRTDKVKGLLGNVFYKTDEERNKAVESFTKSGMTYEEIDSHVAPLRSIKSASVKEGTHKLEQKSAAVDNEQGEDNAFLQLRNYQFGGSS